MLLLTGVKQKDRNSARENREGRGRLTGVAEVDELFGQQVGEQLHDEQQVLVLVLLGRGVAPLAALVVLGVDLQQRQARLVQLHGLGLGRGGTKQVRRSRFSPDAGGDAVRPDSPLPGSRSACAPPPRRPR